MNKLFLRSLSLFLSLLSLDCIDAFQLGLYTSPRLVSTSATTATPSRSPCPVSALRVAADNNDKDQDEAQILATLDNYIHDKDWQGLETYWQQNILQNEQQDLSTQLLNKRLKALGKQGKAKQAEDLLRSYLNDNDKNHKETIVDEKSWVRVLRAYASLMGRDKDTTLDNNNNDDDDDDSNDDTRLKHMQQIMKEMAKKSHVQPKWKPTIAAYNALLQAMAQHKYLPNKGQQAERILFGLLDNYNNYNQQHQQGKNDDTYIVIPNADTFFHVYQANKGTRYPKVETLWHLQTSLYQQQQQQQQQQQREQSSSTALSANGRALIPSVRNLNAALAVLARSHIANKAYKGQLLVQQLQQIRQQAMSQQPQEPGHTNNHDDNNNDDDKSDNTRWLPHMQPNLGTYKNLMYAAAFTSHAHSSPRERKQALEIAQDVHKTVLALVNNENDDDNGTTTTTSVPVRDQTLFYRLALQAVGHLVDNTTQRDGMAIDLFQACCEAGLVDASVVTAFDRAASETVVLKLLGGFAEDLMKLPSAWTAAASTFTSSSTTTRTTTTTTIKSAKP